MHLCNQEVHIFLDKDVNLLLKNGLDIVLTLAAEVRGGLRDSSCHQTITLIGHLPGQVTSCFVYLLPLQFKKGKRTLSRQAGSTPCFHALLQAVGFMPTLVPSCHPLLLTRDEDSEQLVTQIQPLLTVKR